MRKSSDSTQIPDKIRQIRQPSRPPFQYAPLRLPADFPIRCGTFVYFSEKPYSHDHLHDCFEIGFCHEGGGVFVIAEKLYAWQKGDIVIINHRERHFAAGRGKTRCRWTWIYLDPLKLLVPDLRSMPVLETDSFWGKKFCNLLHSRDHPDIARLIENMIEELKSKERHYQDSVRGMVLALMAKLHRLPGLSPKETSPASKADFERLHPAFSWIREHFSEKISMGKLAGACGLGVSRFRSVFREAMGKSPNQFLIEYRLAMACVELKSGNAKILRIALETGFPTLSCFNRAFAKKMGLSPRKWRKKADPADL